MAAANLEAGTRAFTAHPSLANPAEEMSHGTFRSRPRRPREATLECHQRSFSDALILPAAGIFALQVRGFLKSRVKLDDRYRVVSRPCGICIIAKDNSRLVSADVRGSSPRNANKNMAESMADLPFP